MASTSASAESDPMIRKSEVSDPEISNVSNSQDKEEVNNMHKFECQFMMGMVNTISRFTVFEVLKFTMESSEKFSLPN